MNLFTTKDKHKNGFTIVELLVVIVIIGILAAVTMVSYSGITTKAKTVALQSDLANNSDLLKLYNVTYGSYPTALDANKCPTAPNVDTNYCLKPSSGITLTYQPSSTTGVASDFSLYASKDALNYRITSDNAMSPQSISLVCPYGFIVVPGSTTYSTTDFCVMKYEAKIQGQNDGNQTYSAAFIPESRASGTPWVNISQTNAIAEAPTACTGCHLITEAEWMTIAQNVLNNPVNWRDNVVGTGSSSTNYIYSGHNDNAPANALAASTDNDGYYGTGQTTGTQKRTLTLSNGEVIWDIAGNVYDWTNATIGANLQPGLSGEVAYALKQWNNASLLMNGLPALSQPSSTGIAGVTTWSSTQGIGQLSSNYGETGARAFLRGGLWNSGGNAGVLYLNLSGAPSYANAAFGFRVSR